LEECRKTDRHVEAETGTWTSTRLSLKDDGMGFSFHITTIFAGTETHIHYKNHLETVYCISGDGEIQTVKYGTTYQISPGTLYIVNENDEHYLRGGSEDMILACAFNPPVTGKEVHQADGSYAIVEN